MLKKLIILILLNFTGQTIAFSQAKDSSDICLTQSQFKFYYKTLIRFNGLKVDTANLNAQLKTCDGVVRDIDKQLDDCNLIVKEKNEIIRTDTIAFNKLSVKYGKQEKKVKRLKETTLVFIATTLVLAIIVILK